MPNVNNTITVPIDEAIQIVIGMHSTEELAAIIKACDMTDPAKVDWPTYNAIAFEISARTMKVGNA